MPETLASGLNCRLLITQYFLSVFFRSQLHPPVSSMVENNIIAAGELQNIQPSLHLNGKNYLKWSEFVQTFFKGKGKLSHLLETGPKSDDLKFAAWDEEDSMVMSWLWNLMIPEVSDVKNNSINLLNLEIKNK